MLVWIALLGLSLTVADVTLYRCDGYEDYAHIAIIWSQDECIVIDIRDAPWMDVWDAVERAPASEVEE